MDGTARPGDTAPTGPASQPPQRALILVPAGSGDTLPDYLLAMVAGLPLLDRLILTVWRAGVPRVTLLARPKVRHCLERHLAPLSRRGGGSLDVVSRLEALESYPEHPWLVLSADTLPAPAWLQRFVETPLESGSAALALAPAAGELPAPDRGTAADCWTALGALGPETGPRRPGALALVSAAAWQGWWEWRRGEGAAAARAASTPEAALFGYLAHLRQQGRLVPVAAEPMALSLISRREDLKDAANRLVISLTGSPWDEGFLEYSLNRRLARRLLLHLATAPITPNQITLLDLSLGLLAVLLFLTGTYWGSLAGALLLPLVMVLDCLDGMLARLTFRETRLGLMLDLYGDTVLNLLVFLALSVGRYRATGQGFYLVLLLPLATGYLWCWRLTDPLWDRPRPAAPPLGPGDRPRALAGQVVNEIASRDFVYLILLFAVLDRLEWFVAAVALGTHLFALALTWLSRRRQGKN